jgi:hypothetical protein
VPKPFQPKTGFRNSEAGDDQEDRVAHFTHGKRDIVVYDVVEEGGVLREKI